MKIATYKKISQKGLSPIILVVILAVIGLGAFVLYSNSKKSPATPSVNNSVSNNQQAQSASESLPGLTKVEGDVYVFYYPKDYVKSDKDIGDARILFYVPSDRKDTKEGISLAKYSVSTRMETPTSEFCKEFLQFSLRSTKTVRIVDAKPVAFVKSHGCDFTYVDDSVPGKLAVHEKQLWYKEGNNLNGYGSKALYLLTTSQAEKDTIDLAVNNFTLK